MNGGLEGWRVSRSQKAEGRRQKSEDRSQKTEDRRQKTEARRQKSGDRSQKTGVRRQKTEDRSLEGWLHIHTAKHLKIKDSPHSTHSTYYLFSILNPKS